MNQNQRFGKGSAGSDAHQESIQELWSKSITNMKTECPTSVLEKLVLSIFNWNLWRYRNMI